MRRARIHWLLLALRHFTAFVFIDAAPTEAGFDLTGASLSALSECIERFSALVCARPKAAIQTIFITCRALLKAPYEPQTGQRLTEYPVRPGVYEFTIILRDLRAATRPPPMP